MSAVSDALEIGASRRPRPGEHECGDDYLIAPGARTLIAIADGLGHGPAAAAAARSFLDFVRAHLDLGVEEILRGAGPALTGTRGVAATVLAVESGGERFSISGVGNIEVHVLGRGGCHPVSAAGVVGQPVRRYLTFADSLAAGDTIVLHSDGISSRVDLPPLLGLSAERLAATLVDRHAKAHDDASCVVVRRRR